VPAHSTARTIGFAALREWRAGRRFIDAILHDRLADNALTKPDRAFATDLVFGVLRNLRLLDFWIAELRSASVDKDARDVLRLGLYQLLVLNIAEHAAVNETVALAPQRARGLINAVLRSAVRRRAELLVATTSGSLALRTSHPDFLVQRWVRNFGEQNAAALCAWNNVPPPVYVRINQLKSDRDTFRSAHPACEALTDYPTFLRCEQIPHEWLASGDCYIQDPSTSVACVLLDPQPNERILDACAAPGGKTGFIAELMRNHGLIVATDRDSGRVARLHENLDRLEVMIAKVSPCDWTQPQTCRDLAAVAPFDRILLDAPCSNTGVMRRRVDVRWRLSADDLPRMQREQIAIAGAVLPLLKPGGVFVYSTCSIEPEENEEVVSQLVRLFPHLQLESQRALLPFRDRLDGAFAARFRRRG
jgi:16S rRNA (cytosine967-C5)-methyltransferase